MRNSKKFITGAVAAVMMMSSTMMVGAAGGNWVNDANGWWYQNTDASYVKSAWMQEENGNWFHFNASGYMQTGWVLDGTTWYYLNPAADGTQGVMKTGWIQDAGAWYYLNPVSDGTRGAMKTGWVLDAGKWYYMDKSSGKMEAGKWVTDGGKSYFVAADGSWTGAEYTLSYSSDSSDSSSNTPSAPVIEIKPGDFGEVEESKTEVKDGTTVMTVTNKAGDEVVVSKGSESTTSTVKVTVNETKPMAQATVEAVVEAKNSVANAVEEAPAVTKTESKSAAAEAVQSNSEVKVAVVLPDVTTGAEASKKQTVSVVAAEDTEADEVADVASTVAESIIDTADNSAAGIVYNGKAYNPAEAKSVVNDKVSNVTVAGTTKTIYVLVKGEYVEYTIDVSTVSAQ